MRNILSINGGGIRDLSFLYILLRLSEKYEKENKDFYNKFNVFSGVSSGSIIASVLALREKVLEKFKEDEENYKKFLQYWNNNIGKTLSVKITKFLIFLFDTEKENIFSRTFFYRLISLDGYLFSKYTDTKEKIFKKYINFNINDVPKNRVLVIKAVDLEKQNSVIFTNSKNIEKIKIVNGNKISENLYEIVNFSSNAPTYFPSKKNIIDGGTLINNVLDIDLLLFTNDKVKILNFNYDFPITYPPFFNGMIGYLSPILDIFLHYPSLIQKNMLESRLKNNIYFQNITLDNISLDAISPSDIKKITSVGINTDISGAIKFYNSI